MVCVVAPVDHRYVLPGLPAFSVAGCPEQVEVVVGVVEMVPPSVTTEEANVAQPYEFVTMTAYVPALLTFSVCVV